MVGKNDFTWLGSESYMVEEWILHCWGWVLHGGGMNLTWLGSESYMVGK